MFSRKAITKFFALALVYLTVAGNAWAGKKKKRKPNIIFILADDLGYGDLSCYGQTKFSTPNIDRMAERGLRFTDHYSGSTVCAPSRCTLMTGFHTGHSYIRGNQEVKPEGQLPIPASSVTVAEVLKQAGYTTGVIGKWGMGYPGSEGDPNNQGFDYFFGYNCQREAHHYYPTHLWRNQERVEYPENNLKEKKGKYSHDLFTEDALRFVRENKDNPFFLYLAYSVPHADVDVPEDSMKPFIGKFDEKPYKGGGYLAQPTPKAAHAGMVTRMDGDIGKLNKLLADLDIDENTLVIFTSDNGPHVEGGHNPAFFNSAGGLRGVKRDLYEGGIRAPFIAMWPGTVKAGSETDHPSAFWDFLPTACEIAGYQAPVGIDGISYLPTLLGKSPKQKKHEYLYWEFHTKAQTRDKQAVRKGDWKGVRMKIKTAGQPIELYNLAKDPGEKNNVASKYPEIVAEITAIMDQQHVKSEYFPFSYESTKIRKAKTKRPQ
ncbi:arylsulfatase [Fulvitalea axinellae]